MVASITFVAEEQLILKYKIAPDINIYESKGPGGGVLPLWPNWGSGLFEGPDKDYQMAQFREITLPLRGILVVTTL